MASGDDDAGEFVIPVDEPTGSKDRATVALVLSEIRNVTTLVNGHRDLTRQGLENIQRQLDAISFLPGVVAKVQQELSLAISRLDKLEKRDQGRAEYRRVNLPTIVISGVAVLTAIVGLITQLH